ncbi:MAG TPA: PleD family two-component system response regulator [Desulfobulbus sp.]|nr:PleD family two-component system response regulator [Desulfobulbus sp.]
MTDDLQDLDTTLHEIQDYRITVLLVDDQQMIAEAVRRALESEELDFHYCQNPTRAIDMATSLEPTIILQDLVMPELDGLTMVKFFRANPVTAQVPIIVLSTKEEPEIKSKAFELGANDYLVKLPDRIELIARIRYHSRAYISQKQRDEAFEALRRSQRKLAEANKVLERLSSLDGLTGVPNRRRFDQLLRKEWQRAIRHGSSISIIMMDIDFFKLFNDTYGHQGGDDCLRQVAGILEKSVQRETDMVARYGGEEFVAILPETGVKGALAVAEDMRANVEARKIPHENSKITDHVTISVGVATTVPERGSQPEDLIAAADQALYQAKNNGRNRVQSAGFHSDSTPN